MATASATFFVPSDTISLFTPPSSSFSSTSRNQLSFPQRHIFCRANQDESPSPTLRVVPSNQALAEREEAKAVLVIFFKKLGMTYAVVKRTVNRSELFVDHLIERLRSVYRHRYQVGRELTTYEIRDALIPYVESLVDEYGDLFVDFVENFPNSEVKPILEETVQKPPLNVTKTSTPPISSRESATKSKKAKALGRVHDISPTANLPPHIVYLVELGMELDVIKDIIRKFPAFAYYSLDGKVKPVVQFLINLGIPESDIPIIISKRPQLCGVSLSENLIPTMSFLEELGVDKKQWAKVIYRFPALLTYSRSKLRAAVDFLYEMGLSSENVSKVLTRWPTIISYSVDEKLRPTAEYFRSLGVDVASLISRSPQTFGLSVEANLKPVTEFFLERGYTVDNIATMVSRYGALYTFSLSLSLVPKWEYFLTMGYPKGELIRFPQYFGYSLENRIKPRHAIVKENDVQMTLNSMLSQSEQEFERILGVKIRQKNANLDA